MNCKGGCSGELADYTESAALLLRLIPFVIRGAREASGVWRSAPPSIKLAGSFWQINFRRRKILMSELREPRWSVVSERGCEASGANYDEAAGLVRRLREEKIHGLCIISDEAARRYNANNNGAAPTTAAELKPAAPPAKKRAPRRKNAKLS
jgi:hypothetical protein